MKLHENKDLFRQAIQFTAQQMALPEIYVEKDYWVTFALYLIFTDPIGEETVFKGGTSLLKCFNTIERFSEDIDLIVLRREGEANNKLTNKIKKIGEVVSKVLPELQVDNITQKRGMNRKTAHSYTKEFNGEFGQVRDVIIVEATWLGYYEPYIKHEISSFIYDMMMTQNQKSIAEEYNLLPFMAKVLEPRRTICEKIMSLVRFSHGDNPIEDLKKKIRHVYDLHQLLKVKDLSDFFDSDEFEKLLLKVGQDDVISYPNNNTWLKYHPNEAIIFKMLEDGIWKVLRKTYNEDFRALVFGSSFPDEKDIVATLKRIKERLEKIIWTVKVE